MMEKTIKSIKRLRNSYAGNPAFEITFEGGLTLKTKANIADAYKVTDAWAGKRVKVETETSKSGKTQIVGLD